MQLDRYDPSHSGDHQGIARRAVREIESLDVRIMEAKAEAATVPASPLIHR